jgi:hypothetical protein
VPPQPPSSPSATVSPAPVQTQRALYVTGYNGPTAPEAQLHEVTITDGVASDRILLRNKSLDLIDINASSKMALITIGLLPQKLAILDLSTDTYRLVPIAVDYGVSAVFSPDGNQALLSRFGAPPGASWFMLDPLSGHYRQLTRSGGPADLVPVRWTSSGMLAASGGNDGEPVVFWRVDPQTWRVSLLSSGYYVPEVSPDGEVITSTPYVPLGDSLCQCQGNWSNSLSVTHLGGARVQIAAQKNRDFSVTSVENDGSVLFTVDNGTASFTQSVSADAGLYLASGGPPRLQFRQRVWDQWGGTLLGSSQALLSQTIGDHLEVDLAHLCGAADSTCTPSFTKISAIPPGSYPNVEFLVLPQ